MYCCNQYNEEKQHLQKYDYIKITIQKKTFRKTFIIKGFLCKKKVVFLYKGISRKYDGEEDFIKQKIAENI